MAGCHECHIKSGDRSADFKRHYSSLLESPLFEDIPGRVIRELYSLGRIVRYETQETLFERGDGADELLILLEGVVELLFPVHVKGVTREVTMESKQAGDVVAWSSIVKPYHFTLSACTASPCTLIQLSRKSLTAFFKKEPFIGYLFMRNLAYVIAGRLQAIQMMWMHELRVD